MLQKRIERGWGGHFVGANQCWFRRNTLLDFGETKIVVSTVGNYHFYQNNSTEIWQEEIGLDRYYETKVFHAIKKEGEYWGADFTREVSFGSKGSIAKEEIQLNGMNIDNIANEMHEKVCDEMIYVF